MNLMNSDLSFFVVMRQIEPVFPSCFARGFVSQSFLLTVFGEERGSTPLPMLCRVGSLCYDGCLSSFSDPSFLFTKQTLRNVFDFAMHVYWASLLYQES